MFPKTAEQKAKDKAQVNPGMLVRHKRTFYLYHIDFIWCISWNYCPKDQRKYLAYKTQENWIVTIDPFSSWNDPSFKTIREAYNAIMAKDHIY